MHPLCLSPDVICSHCSDMFPWFECPQPGQILERKTKTLYQFIKSLLVMYGSLVLIALYRITGEILKRISLYSVHLISALASVPLRTYLGTSREMESKVKISMKVIYSSKTWAMHPCHTVSCQNATGPFIYFFQYLLLVIINLRNWHFN